MKEKQRVGTPYFKNLSHPSFDPAHIERARNSNLKSLEKLPDFTTLVDIYLMKFEDPGRNLNDSGTLILGKTEFEKLYSSLQDGPYDIRATNEIRHMLKVIE